MSGFITAITHRLLRVMRVPDRHQFDHSRMALAPHTPACTPFKPPGIPIAPTVRGWYEPIDGAAAVLVRPYLTAHEHEETARLQRLRPDTPWFAAYGVGPNTGDIHRWLGAA
ncbi:hypothetical protein OG787_33595 [Streptomyces sp. NBC_00075]|uniref:hypothetical protein n=1 Tax=Streptomyces sp. NBC_00075 TaxID=2975641 RepID=UPI00324991EE